MTEPVTKRERASVLRAADLVEGRLVMASESGLFHGKNEASEEDKNKILIALENSRTSARSNDPKEFHTAARKVREADLHLHKAILRKKAIWRLVYLYRIPIIAYQLTILAVVVGLALDVRFRLPDWMPILVTVRRGATIWGVPVAAAGFGILGAVLRSLYWHHRKIQLSQFYDRFLVGHISAPWIGGILGILVYMVVLAGLVVVSGEDARIENQLFVYALALAAGFSWERAMPMLESVAARMGGEGRGGSKGSKEKADGEADGGDGDGNATEDGDRK